MGFIDVHNHLDFYSDLEIEKIIKSAREIGVKIIIVNGVNPASNNRVIKLSEKYPEIKASLGFYPSDAIKLSKEELQKGVEFIEKNKNKIIAIGEIGLDLKELKEMEFQKEIFVKMLKFSKKLDKPVIVHSRKAEKNVIEILEDEKMKKVIMHCFNGNFKLVERVIENNWFLSIPTNVKNSEHFQKIIEVVSIENLLCETDSPFLHPDKKRNNESANVIESYKKISEIKKMPLEQIKKQIYNNYKNIFNTD